MRLEPLSTLGAAQRCWAQAVGPAIAASAQPVAEREGVLHVACHDAVWAHELELMGPALIDALNAVIGREALSSMRVRTDASDSSRRGRRFG